MRPSTVSKGTKGGGQPNPQEARRKKANAASIALKTAKRLAWQTYPVHFRRGKRATHVSHVPVSDAENAPKLKSRNPVGIAAEAGVLSVRGSVDYQINRIFVESGIFRPGTSRHKEKDEARRQLAAENYAATSEALADATGLHSYTYARDCKDTWHRLGHFARQSLGLKDMAVLRGPHVEAYLLQRIRDGISYGSWKKEAAHLGKLENALREWSETSTQSESEAISPDIRMAALDPELRVLAREQLNHGGKDFGHFSQPEVVIARLESASQPAFALVARIQLEGGARCREACRITKEQLHGVESDPITGRTKGQIHLTDTKGGKPRTIQVSTELYAELETAVRRHKGVLHVSMGSYAKAVHAAAGKAGETLGGTHAFRYCFARRRYRELTMPAPQGAGLTHEAAIQQVSWEMGHERASITMLYLR